MKFEDLENPIIKKITENIYAILNLFHVSKKATVNSGVIFTSNSVIFIDSGMKIDSAKFIWNSFASQIKANINMILKFRIQKKDAHLCVFYIIND